MAETHVEGQIHWQDLHWDERLRIASEPSSAFAEAFGLLRAKILHYNNGRRVRTILVTSCMPAEGKGFVCANLGVAIAKSMGQQALLIDCDLRLPTLAALFGVDSEPGLADYLQGRTELSTLIRKTDLPKLSVIPAGEVPSNPTELLDSGPMSSLMEELKGQYEDRIVLLDSPPVLVASESAVLARYADGVILVVRWGEAGKEQVKRLVDEIGREKIIGVVFNGNKINKLETALYNKRYYGYYQGKYYGKYYGGSRKGGRVRRPV